MVCKVSSDYGNMYITHAMYKRLPSFQVAQWLKNLPVGDAADAGLIPGSERYPGERHGIPLQCSCLENPMDREAWQAIAHKVAKSSTQLKWQNTAHKV